MADVYRRTGRGGAGNFYSKNDIEEATKAAADSTSKDIEAQKQQPADDIPTDPADPPSQQHARNGSSSTAPPTYARTGRGGAGNFVDPTNAIASTTPSTSSPPTSPTSSIAPSTPAPATVARSGLSGRGGAGNWTTVPDQGGEENVYDAEQERKRREALDAHILKDIRDSLPQPPKIHYMHGPGRGRKPEASPTTPSSSLV